MSLFILVMSALSAVISVLPVFLGFEYITAVSLCVTLSMLILAILSAVKE